jgi:hypothetical protein
MSLQRRSSRHIIDLNNSPVVRHAKSRKQQQAKQVRRAINFMHRGASTHFKLAPSLRVRPFQPCGRSIWMKIRPCGTNFGACACREVLEGRRQVKNTLTTRASHSFRFQDPQLTCTMKLKLAFEGAKSIADLGNNTFVVTMDGGESVEFSLVCASVLKTETKCDILRAPPKALTANAKKALEMAAAAESSCKAFPGTERDPVDLITPKSAAMTNSSLNSTHSSSTNIDELDELDDLDESDESNGLDSPGPLVN